MITQGTASWAAFWCRLVPFLINHFQPWLFPCCFPVGKWQGGHNLTAPLTEVRLASESLQGGKAHAAVKWCCVSVGALKTCCNYWGCWAVCNRNYCAGGSPEEGNQVSCSITQAGQWTVEEWRWLNSKDMLQAYSEMWATSWKDINPSDECICMLEESKQKTGRDSHARIGSEQVSTLYDPY